MTKQTTRTLKVNHKLLAFLTKRQPIKVAIGGRGSGKSIGVGDMLTFKMDTERCDIYCLREFQDSISDSVHRVFEDSITKRLNLSGWDIQQNKIISPYGNCTTYKGANRNPDAMQSAQGYKYSWFEEAHRASQASLDKLLPTILRNPGAQCWFTANPQSSADAFSKRFITPYLDKLRRDGFYEDELHFIVFVNWSDNPWWNQEQEALRSWDFKHMTRAKYHHVWEGAFNDEVERSIIKTEWFDAAIDAHKLDRLKNVLTPKGARIAAHDPSDTGNDAKGYASRHGSVFLKIKKKTDGEIDKGCDWALALAKGDLADWFVWDCDGMGAGLKRQVDQALKGTKCQSYAFKGSLSGVGQDHADEVYQGEIGEKPNAQNEKLTFADVFKNNRAQYYKLLADRFYNTYRCIVEGEYIDPDEMISIDSSGVDDMQELRSEVCRIPDKPNNNGLYQILSKKEMADMDIASPNMADSMMMAMFRPTKQKKWASINNRKVSIV